MRYCRICLVGAFAVCAFMAAVPVSAQEPIERRDYHYRLSPNAHPQYRYYPAPRIYYPRRPQDRPALSAPPERSMRDPRGPLAPHYGLPPPPIERIPRT